MKIAKIFAFVVAAALLVTAVAEVHSRWPDYTVAVGCVLGALWLILGYLCVVLDEIAERVSAIWFRLYVTMNRPPEQKEVPPPHAD